MAIACVAIAGFAWAQPEAPRRGEGPRGPRGGERAEAPPRVPELHAGMESLKDDLKAIASAVRSPDAPLDDAIERCASMERVLIECKAMTPAPITELPPDAQRAELLAYKRAQAEALATLAQVEIALIDGDRELAWKLVSGPLLEARKSGHQRFNPHE
ncbi:MAG: hypothetical protein RBS39_00790 [Phycisphaerales bacterium]|jgi:hypothetical protein|nr:hypothetical protein [Phycisphaerales bacterium]